MRELLEAGVHFGHQTKRWNPKMKKYIFGERSGIYIIDLQKTLLLFKESCEFVKNVAADGGGVLFVGTKKQGQDVIAKEASRCGMHWVNQRWLGGMLTNFFTIKKSINRLKELESMKNDGIYEALPKKEVLKLEKERLKLEKNLLGIKDLEKIPDVVFIVDPKREKIPVLEARKLQIPIVAVVDTNCNPDEIDYVIPGNDDAIRSINLMTSKIADAVLEGRKIFEATQAALAEKKEKEAQARKAAREKEREEAKERKASKGQDKGSDKIEPTSSQGKPDSKSKKTASKKAAGKKDNKTKSPTRSVDKKGEEGESAPSADAATAEK